MLKYEYLVVTRQHRGFNDEDDLYRVLNSYADDGWWIVLIDPQSTTDRIVFERVLDKSNTRTLN